MCFIDTLNMENKEDHHMGWKPVKKVKVTIRGASPYREVKRNVYHKAGYGTYIIYKGKKRLVHLTRHDNSAYTL